MPVKLTANSRIIEGERLRISYYHSILVYEDRLNSCLCEPKIYDSWREEIRIHRGIEFRCGNRTAGKWAAFCPKCHMPASNIEGFVDVSCSDGTCKWHVKLNNVPLSKVIGEL